MKLWGKNKEHIRVADIQATKAVVVLHQTAVECNVRLVSEDGEVLDLTIPDHLLPEFVLDLTDVYEAIHPPLRRGSRIATWRGMDNGS
jgi:hypothetical protein